MDKLLPSPSSLNGYWLCCWVEKVNANGHPGVDSPPASLGGPPMKLIAHSGDTVPL